MTDRAALTLALRVGLCAWQGANGLWYGVARGHRFGLFRTRAALLAAVERWAACSPARSPSESH